MKQTHDLEQLFSDFEALMKDPTDGLNAQIALVNTEKSDSIVLKTIDGAAYLFNQLNDKVANFDPFVIYFIINPGTLSTYGGVANNLEFGVGILLADTNQDIFIQKRMLRYQKALAQFVNKNWNRIRYAPRFEIKDEAPYVTQLAGRSEWYRIAGITIQTAIA